MPIISGGGSVGGGVTVVFDTTVGNNTTTIIDTGANAVPAGFRVLHVYLYGRTDENFTTTDLQWRVNNDSGANYDRVFMAGSAANFYQSDESLAATSWLIDVPAATDPEPASFALNTLVLYDYDSSAAWKIGHCGETRCSSTGSFSGVLEEGIRWRSTAAITRVSVTPLTAGVHFIAGTRMSVFLL